MKKYILFFFLVLSYYSFANVQDTLKIIPKEDFEKIEKKIAEIEKKRDLKVYVNTLEEGEGFQVTDPERTVLLNLNRNKEEIKVKLSFSRDIDLEEEEEQVNLILDNAASLLVAGKPGEYVYQVSDGVEYLLENVDISDPAEIMQQKEEEGEFRKGLLISVGIILLLSLKIIFDIWKKRKQY